MTVSLSVGTRIYVAADHPATYTIAGFEALDFTEVGEVVNMGEFGGEAQISQHIGLDGGVVVKRKGSKDYGTMALQIGKDHTDAGQEILKAGFDGANAYDVHSFKITESGEVAYFTGLVGSFTLVKNDANTVTALGCNIELDDRVISDEAPDPVTGEYLLAWGPWRFPADEVELVA
jgi:hypothetical protein